MIDSDCPSPSKSTTTRDWRLTKGASTVPIWSTRKLSSLSFVIRLEMRPNASHRRVCSGVRSSTSMRLSTWEPKRVSADDDDRSSARRDGRRGRTIRAESRVSMGKSSMRAT